MKARSASKYEIRGRLKHTWPMFSGKNKTVVLSRLHDTILKNDISDGFKDPWCFDKVVFETFKNSVISSVHSDFKRDAWHLVHKKR